MFKKAPRISASGTRMSGRYGRAGIYNYLKMHASDCQHNILYILIPRLFIRYEYIEKVREMTVIDCGIVVFSVQDHFRRCYGILWVLHSARNSRLWTTTFR
jgi:hypothetical protein